MMRSRLAVVFFVVCCTPMAISRAADATDEELEKHLESMRSEVNNPALSMARRERFALDMAATLDRAALAAPTSEARRARWTQAINLIDGFEQENPGHPQTHQFQLQAAVFLWARGHLWAEQARLVPTDRAARQSAVENFDVAITRLRSLNNTQLDASELLSQNIRFRLAQALA